jgi:hypothetical protein
VGPDLPDKEELDQTDVILFAIPTEGVRLVSTSYHCGVVLNLISGRLSRSFARYLSHQSYLSSSS